MIVLGIDPGKSGAIAWIDTEAEKADAVNYRKMPETIGDLWQVFAEIQPDVAYIEKVASSPQMGVKSAFTFGQGFGHLEMALTAVKCQWHYVLPVKWQKAMNCLTKGDKNVSKAAAQRLFPWLKITHANADALLIALYAGKQEREVTVEELGGGK